VRDVPRVCARTIQRDDLATELGVDGRLMIHNGAITRHYPAAKTIAWAANGSEVTLIGQDVPEWLYHHGAVGELPVGTCKQDSVRAKPAKKAYKKRAIVTNGKRGRKGKGKAAPKAAEEPADEDKLPDYFEPGADMDENVKFIVNNVLKRMPMEFATRKSVTWALVGPLDKVNAFLNFDIQFDFTFTRAPNPPRRIPETNLIIFLVTSDRPINHNDIMLQIDISAYKLNTSKYTDIQSFFPAKTAHPRGVA